MGGSTVTTSSLLKLANHAMHGAETWYNVYLSVSMTTINKKWPRDTFEHNYSSLLKLAHHTMHKGETWYACIFCFHDDHQQKWPRTLLNITTSSPLKLAHHTIVRMCI